MIIQTHGLLTASYYYNSNSQLALNNSVLMFPSVVGYTVSKLFIGLIMIIKIIKIVIFSQLNIAPCLWFPKAFNQIT